MKNTFAALILLFSVVLNASATDHIGDYSSLQERWQVYEDGVFKPFADASRAPDVVYIQLGEKDFGNHELLLRSVRPLHLFVNNQMVAAGTIFRLDVDSVMDSHDTGQLLIALHHKGRHHDLFTGVRKKGSHDLFSQGLLKREGSFFRDFAVLGMLVLMVFGVVVVRLNPKLAGDYLSFPGIFSTRETQDSQVYTRIGSSTNILFYVLCSMLLAYYLIVTFHFTDDIFPAANAYRATDLGGVSFQWAKLSAIILLVFLLKIILVFGTSSLFGMPHIAGVHFFNWVRVLLVLFGILTVVLFVYFIWHGQKIEVHATMLKLVAWIVGAWIILIFLKLSGYASASMFHLFSYICATELIPFLFMIRVLYK